jgi:putative FmdB family regulatory protein
MPIFEFVCTTCDEPFEELVRSASAIDQVACPVCGSKQVKKKISTFAARVAGSSSFSLGASSAASCSTGSV